MTTPAERRELYLDVQDQVEDHNRAMREEERDGWDGYRERPLSYPDAAEIAELNAEARRDREQARREAGR